jgi:hypothetical protein
MVINYLLCIGVIFFRRCVGQYCMPSRAVPLQVSLNLQRCSQIPRSRSIKHHSNDIQILLFFIDFSTSLQSRVSFVETPEVVVAVSRFEMAATEPVVKGYTLRLLQDLEQDGMKAVKATEDGDDGRGGDVLTVAQFDALFSLNKRRNEVWLELKEHPWLIKKSS